MTPTPEQCWPLFIKVGGREIVPVLWVPLLPTKRLRNENVQFRKSNMAYGHNFEKSLYLHISSANRPNFDTAEETCKHKSEINIIRANIII